ncbi:MAG: hypothetical protein JSV25_07995 [Spirochaetota bacterium]|nr:MAG: hypothetical protein JSV25_07995 [Spirochaetota bacterium]
MIRMIFGKKDSMNKSLILFMLVGAMLLLVSAVTVFADTGHEYEHGRPLEEVLQEIREKQGLGPDDAIDPRKVSNKDLEELGEAVMSIMHPEPEQHEFMDRMMGGEGSESLRRAHIRMGYNYLTSLDGENNGWFGRRGMMGWKRSGCMM